MKSKRLFIVSAAIVFFSIAFSACQSMQVAFPDGVDRNSFIKYEADGRNSIIPFKRTVTFGQYKIVTSIGLGKMSFVTPNEKTTGIIIRKTKTTQEVNGDFTFNILGPGGFFWNGDCRSAATLLKIEKNTSGIIFKKKNLDTSMEVAEYSFNCTMESAEKVKADMVMEETSGGGRSGTITFNNKTFIIKSTNAFYPSGSTMWGATGYYIMSDDRLIAVIDIVNSGAFYIASDADPAVVSAIVASGAVLLAYKDPAEITPGSFD